MAIIYQQDFEGSTVAPATTSNQGPGTAATLISKAGTGVVNNVSSNVIFDTRSLECAASGVDTAYILYTFPSTLTNASMRVYCNILGGALPAANLTLFTLYGGGNRCAVQLRTTGRVYLNDGAGAGVYGTPATAAGTVTPGVPFCIDIAVFSDTATTGKAKFDFYNDPSHTVPDATMVELTTNNFGTTGLQSFRFGKIQAGESLTSDVVYDKIIVTDVYAQQGPYIPPFPPVSFAHSVNIG